MTCSSTGDCLVINPESLFPLAHSISCAQQIRCGRYLLERERVYSTRGIQDIHVVGTKVVPAEEETGGVS